MTWRKYLVNKARYITAGILACLASPWAWYHQQIILSKGRLLRAREQEICAHLGILYSENLRIMEVSQIPNPLRKYSHCFSEQLMERFLADISGITLGQGIYVRKIHADSLELISHELVHIRQYQHAGSIWRFMREYIYQCLTEGYYDAPWEVEARLGSANVIN